MNQQISTALAELPNFPMAATKPSAAHSRRCSVCRHPDRIWIELKFIEWHSPTRIAEQFNLYDRDCIYHHAHATNLYQLRLRNILCIYQHILERAFETPITSHGIMLAIARLERTIRSQLPNPAAGLETTLTRETELSYVPKSAWGEHDQGNEEQDASGHQQRDPGANGGQPGRSVESAPESIPQPANSDYLESQYTPAQVPDSKQPETPESRPSVKNKMPDSAPTPEIKFAQLLHRTPYFPIRIIPDKLKPPD
jgi:hypothetical protein